MADVFHNFPKLPGELQNIIWKMAIRSDEPGAHFFTILNGPREVQISVSLNPGFRAPVLVAPPVFTSKAKENLSAYAIDFGLWTACRASRSFIKHRMTEAGSEILRNLRQRVEGNVEYDFAEFDSPCLMSLLGSGAINRTFVVFHRKDLFFFQQEHDESLDWEVNLWHWFSLLSLRYLTYNSLVNLAFEFDETWAFDTDPWGVAQENNPRGLFLRMLILQRQRFLVELSNWQQSYHPGPFYPKGCNLYLLDYAVRLKPNINTNEVPTFQGNGWKYVVCQESDVGTPSGNYSALNFMKEMDYWNQAYFYGPWEPYIKVLARLKE